MGLLLVVYDYPRPPNMGEGEIRLWVNLSGSTCPPFEVMGESLALLEQQYTDSSGKKEVSLSVLDKRQCHLAL